MKRHISLLLILLALLAVGGVILACNGPGKKVHSVQQKTMYHCPMHPSYISDKPGDCPICGMKLVPINADQHGSTADSASSQAPSADDHSVRIDPVTVQNMGVTTEKVQKRPIVKEIRAGAMVTIDETKLSIVSTKIMGWIDRLLVDYTGKKVRKGQALFELYSPDLVSTQEEYLQALRYARQLAGNDMSGADQLLASTRRRLANWDISEAQIQQLEQRGSSRKTLTIHSPADGIVLEKSAVAGQNIMPGIPLYKIADLSKVWVVANVYQEDLPFVKTGMEATVELPAQPGTIYHGTVNYVSPVLDPASKTVQIRIEVKNTEDYTLKPDMFANIVIASPAPVTTIAVPEQAVIHTGLRSVVILDMGNGYYRPQEVRLGLSGNGYVQVLDGLSENQTIVTSSQFLIDSESNLKTAIGQMSGHGSMPMSQDSAPDHEEMTKNVHHDTIINAANTSTPTDTKQWICTMCPEVKSDKPGKCPKCGMNLVKKS
jgi:RND family efflux transporter MFP subunit